ncbi:hypothetical protein [Rahnella inusitata]|uniref:hypothetical protein n=1 Tax=Rahnella inusitata TaxID=58169 RepID=UPI001BC858BD|nr:hypothetical protein [Rahnella inusitata]QUT17945.1 hypothetical protein I2123_22945 [Rahnella inusitata]
MATKYTLRYVANVLMLFCCLLGLIIASLSFFTGESQSLLFPEPIPLSEYWDGIDGLVKTTEDIVIVFSF